jgi:hypothetical protein
MDFLDITLTVAYGSSRIHDKETLIVWYDIHDH